MTYRQLLCCVSIAFLPGIANDLSAQVALPSLTQLRTGEDQTPAQQPPAQQTQPLMAPLESAQEDTPEPSAPKSLEPVAAGATLRPARDPQAEPMPTPFRPASEEQEASEAPEEKVDVAQLTPQLMRLRSRVLSVLSYHINEPIYTTRHSPWGIMHAMHAFGVETEVSTGSKMVNAAGWLCWNQPCRGRTMMLTKGDRDIELRIGPGYQGHDGQFLALLAQARVQPSFELRIGDQSYTVQDLIEHEQATCRPGTELTFKLIGLSHYLGPKASWNNAYGNWTIPRLIEEELRQPVVGAACGGTHRLMGHSYALSRARKEGLEITGSWQRATDFTLNYQRRAILLRNSDGSFSTNWFEGRGMSGDIDRRLQTTGHILEWMLFSLPITDLTDPRIVQSVDYLATIMSQNRGHQWEIGPRGHAIRALALYDQRVFGGTPGRLDRRLAELVPGHKVR